MNKLRPRSESRKRTLLRSSQRCSPKRSCQTSWKSLCLCSIRFLFLLQFYVASLHRNRKDREAPLHQLLHALHHLSPQQTNHISNCFMKIRRERGKEEVEIHWLPCGVCGKNWEDTWEPATSQHLAVPEVPPPSACEEVLL
ncbi:uncharacterized protein zgc:66472 [Girardinichthys multiradiatus]|uniref:uncharacterized protein zgc:66472 n=1 Tax=Girardinichthys multiradiatus TaxID=208333 RepID=UPI001FAC45D0|nr:uncharacterized protein zgc:66472 [Girardinichthys multiradiatus]